MKTGLEATLSDEGERRARARRGGRAVGPGARTEDVTWSSVLDSGIDSEAAAVPQRVHTLH